MEIQKRNVRGQMHAFKLGTTIKQKSVGKSAICALYHRNHSASYKSCNIYQNLQKLKGNTTRQLRCNTPQSNPKINGYNQFPPLYQNQPQNEPPT